MEVIRIRLAQTELDGLCTDEIIDEKEIELMRCHKVNEVATVLARSGQRQKQSRQRCHFA